MADSGAWCPLEKQSLAEDVILGHGIIPKVSLVTPPRTPQSYQGYTKGLLHSTTFGTQANAGTTTPTNYAMRYV